MMLVLVAQRPHLFRPTNYSQLFRTYFHPSYLVENCLRAVGHKLTAPQVNLGASFKVEEVVALDSDGEEVEAEEARTELRASQSSNPMLPPLNCGRPRTKRIRSRGSASSVDGAPARLGAFEPTREDMARQALAVMEQELEL